MKGLIVAGLSVAAICLVATPIIRTERSAPDLTGPWLATLEFAGQRQFQTVITFSETNARPGERFGEGSWARVSGRRISAAFTLASPDCGSKLGVSCRINATLRLDETGMLRGQLAREVLDQNGNVVDSAQGVAKARGVALKPSGRLGLLGRG